MRINVLLFGDHAKIVGQNQLMIDMGSQLPTCAILKYELVRQNPVLAPGQASLRLAVNHEFACDQQLLNPEDEVAVIGMVSGG